MQVKRHELKYYINKYHTECLSYSLDQVMKKDPYGDVNGEYLVRSLYFDSYNDECLYQKQSGFIRRKKIRLRIYGDSSLDNAKFEIKYKNGSLIGKQSVYIPKDVAQEICNGRYNLLLDFKDPVLDRIYALFSTRLYKPKVIVEYIRKAYVFPGTNVRITLDKSLCSSINNLNLFSSFRNGISAIMEGKQILEIKYDQFIPMHIKKLILNVNTERMAISKYTLARRFHKPYKWQDN